jgi:N-acetylglucosaminyldiphosphoundecaprenol N-acetyl-beta-D-mannosaminyltransferase
MRDLLFSDLTFINISKDDLFQVIEASNHIHLVAASTIVSASKDMNLQKILSRGVAVCDSRILWMTLRILGEKVVHIRGTDFLRSIFATCPESYSHIFIGSSPENLLKLEKMINLSFPNVLVQGTFSPDFGFSFEEIENYLRNVEIANNTIIWVGLGSPLQDKVAFRLNDIFRVPVIGVGAAFDFITGNKKEAPLMMQKLGLEWFYRLISEPKRLWKRYLIGNLMFSYIFFKNLVFYAFRLIDR